MADVTARIGKIAVSADDVTYTDLGGLTDYDLTRTDGETIDVTDFDSNGWKEHLVGLAGGSASFTLNWDEADAGQDIVRTANSARTQIYYRIRPAGDASGAVEYIWQGTITSFGISGAVDGKVELSFDVEFTGEATEQDQTP